MINLGSSAIERMLTWKDHHQETPLHIALRKGFSEIENYLILEGADLNARPKEGSTLSYLWSSPCSGSREHLLRNMLDHDISLQGDECLKEFLSSTTIRGDPGRITMLKILIDLHGAQINGQMHLPLIIARWKPEDFDYIIRTYPKFTARGAQCVLDCIPRCRSGQWGYWGYYHMDVWEDANLKTLISHLRSLGFTNADIFGRDPISGKTPFCAENLTKGIVQTLVAEGGDVNLRDQDNVHPVFYWSKACCSPYQFENLTQWWKEVGVELAYTEVVELQEMVMKSAVYSLYKETAEKVKEKLGGLYVK
jgi:hypothetical protein